MCWGRELRFSSAHANTVLILRSRASSRGVSKDGHGLSWFETALKKRLLTMRFKYRHRRFVEETFSSRHSIRKILLVLA